MDGIDALPWSGRRGCRRRLGVMASARGVVACAVVAAYSAPRVVAEARVSHNEMCFQGDMSRSPEECCGGGGDASCWEAEGSSEELCCHDLPPRVLQCFRDIEERASAKAQKLNATTHQMLGIIRDEGIDLDQFPPEYRQMMVGVSEYFDFYTQLLLNPPTLLNWACEFPPSTMLWSEGCACCDPHEQGLCQMGVEEFDEFAMQPINLRLRAECCYPVYQRRIGLVDRGEGDPALDAAIERHLGDLRLPRGLVARRAPAVSWRMGSEMESRGCLVSVLASGEILPCDEAHACKGFDCSYMRAFIQVVTIIQAIRPLPAFDLLLNPADFTPSRTPSDVPIFTRTGTKWTNTIGLPFEWQLHPSQCRKHVKEVAWAGMKNPWDSRKTKLVWRGSPSNCRAPSCVAGEAEGRNAAMERCGDAFEELDCTWRLETWLRMPRGRLVWISRFLPDSIDAKLVMAEHSRADPALLRFMEEEGLLDDRKPMMEQCHFKYSIAIEGFVAPDRLYWQLFSGSVVLVPEGPWSVFAIADMLEPFVHFVPVRYDLSDLAEKIAWLQAHDDEAQQIAKNAVAFARRYLSCEGIVYFVDRLLRAYAARQVDD